MSQHAQHIHLVWHVEKRIGKLRVLFWSGGGQTFVGRAAHMKALKAAREAAQV